jgi:hypothetical protein
VRRRLNSGEFSYFNSVDYLRPAWNIFSPMGIAPMSGGALVIIAGCPVF